MDVRPHPHINLATVTYLFDGAIEHRDSLGSRKVIEPGAVNLMTAGKGIVHSEMFPLLDPEGPNTLELFQLWLNLPAREKMTRPKYRDLQGAQLVDTKTYDGATLRVIAGDAAGGRIVGPVEGLAERQVRTRAAAVGLRLRPGRSLWKPMKPDRLRPRPRRSRPTWPYVRLGDTNVGRLAAELMAELRRAGAGDGAGGSSLIRLEPPVPVVLEEEPVL